MTTSNTQASFAYGDVVELQGLISRADLNGTYAIVIAPDSAEEAEQLKTSGRTKVTSFPKTLSLKPDNLRVLSESEEAEIDWSFMDGEFPGISGKATVCHMISHATYFVGDTYKCSDLPNHLWTLIARDKGMPPKRYISACEKRAILNSTSSHHIYFLALDRIAHHIVVETRAGSARVFQCYVQRAGDENGDSFGYTAREWITGKPDDPDEPLAPGVLEAREQWGGTAPITRETLNLLLDVLFELEGYTEKIAVESLSQIPKELRGIEEKKNQWAQSILDNPGHVSVCLGKVAGEPTVVSSTEGCRNHPFQFSISSELADPFVKLYRKLIGFDPEAYVFMTMLHLASCIDSNALGVFTGHNARCWGVSALEIPH